MEQLIEEICLAKNKAMVKETNTTSDHLIRILSQTESSESTTSPLVIWDGDETVNEVPAKEAESDDDVFHDIFTAQAMKVIAAAIPAESHQRVIGNLKTLKRVVNESNSFNAVNVLAVVVAISMPEEQAEVFVKTIQG